MMKSCKIPAFSPVSVRGRRYTYGAFLYNMKKILVGGCFDLLHFGHINFLKDAKKYGDYLIVALESDENVRRMKGDNRPIHTQVQRKQMLKALEYVDEVRMLQPMKTDED